MTQHTEPSKSEFDSAEQSSLDIMSTRYPGMLTKPGSAIRELLVRPLAYLGAWFRRNVSETLEKTSLTYLSASQLTENETADEIAANYFVARRAGARSKGAITIVMKSAVLDIPAGASFSADGSSLNVERRVVCTGKEYKTTNNIQYVPVFPYDTENNLFTATIPVVASTAGSLEIAEGVSATWNFVNSLLVSASLTSAVTGGVDDETDASLMERARYNTASAGIGSYYGLRKKLDQAPVTVTGLNLLAGEDALLYRARFNTTNINPGGYVDCYVKTQTQRSTATVTAACVSDSSATFQDTAHAGAYGVHRLFIGDTEIKDFYVSFESSDPSTDGNGARLGINQSIVVTATALKGAAASDVHALISYMPGIYELQQFMDRDENRFIGQDVEIKAAVPVSVRIDCVLKYDGTATDAVVGQVKQAIADKVNSYPVGTKLLNFSDLQDAVSTIDGAELRLPCAISADVMLKDGSFDSFHTVSGVLNIEAASQFDWDPAICFFSSIKSSIRLDIA